MAFYRCLRFNRTGILPGITPLRAATDVEARRLAMELLHQSPEVDRLEVWLDGDLVFRLNQRQAKLEKAASIRE